MIIYELINIIEYIINNSNDNNFSNIVENFRNKLSVKIDKFKGIEEIAPKFVLFDLFNIINEDFKANKIFLNNNIFEGINELPNLPKNKFNEIYDYIEYYKNNFPIPFINDFFFISLYSIKCTKCNNILKIHKIEVKYSIKIPSEKSGKISDLINNYIFPSSKNDNNQNYRCLNCSNNILGRKQKNFLNTPKYLFIIFEGKKLVNKNLNNIDLSEFILSDIGPKKYNLYAFISKEKNEKYSAYIRNEEGWNLYLEENEIQETRIQSFNYCFPYIAVYKGY